MTGEILADSVSPKEVRILSICRDLRQGGDGRIMGRETHVAALGRQATGFLGARPALKFGLGQERRRGARSSRSASMERRGSQAHHGRHHGTALRVFRHGGDPLLAQIGDHPGVGVGIEPETAQLHPHDRRDGRHLDFVG